MRIPSKDKSKPVLSKLIKNKLDQSFYNVCIQFKLFKLQRYIGTLCKPDAIFIWPPKNAGSSITHLLSKHGMKKVRSMGTFSDSYINSGLNTYAHIDLNKLVNEGHISKKYFSNSFKFSFSRNPFARAVSLYNYLKPRSEEIPDDYSFLDFMKLLEKTQIPPIGLYNRKGLSQANPQLRWYEGIKLDYLGSVETLDEDLSIITNKIKINKLNNAPHKNQSTHKEIQHFFCKESEKIVRDIYQEDFEHLGYSKSLADITLPPNRIGYACDFSFMEK